MNKYWILAENETFFLPNLLAKLADSQRIEGIIEIQFKIDLRKKIRSLLKLVQAFDLLTVFKIFFCILWANIINLFFSNRFYSIRKVAISFQLPYYKVHGFEDAGLNRLLEEKINSNPVFVQVSKKVPVKLTEKYFFINKHCSLLPSYAGVYPVFWAMLNGEEFQGISLHRMDENFDTGKILEQSKIENIGSFFSIYHTLYDLSYNMLIRLISFNMESLEPEKTNLAYSYFSFPSQKKVKSFKRKLNKFGIPFRFHPSIK